MLSSCSGPLSRISAKNPLVQFQSSVFGPEAMRCKVSPYAGSQVAYRRNSAAYSWGVKFPPHPQDSFPTPQYFTPKGSGYPAVARTSDRVVVPAGELQNSTHCWKADAGSVLTFAAR